MITLVDSDALDADHVVELHDTELRISGHLRDLLERADVIDLSESESQTKGEPNGSFEDYAL